MALLLDPMFWMSVVGTVTGVAGLYYAIISWREAKSAKIAAADAIKQIRGIHSLVDTSRLQMLCKETHQYLDIKKYQLAKQYVLELLRGVNHLKADPNTKMHLEHAVWRQVTADLLDIDNALQDVEDGFKFEGVRECKRRIIAIEEIIIVIASKCQLAAEELK